MGVFFFNLINFFQDDFLYEKNLKSVYLICSAILGLVFYISISILIKAFKINDIRLKY